MTSYIKKIRLQAISNTINDLNIDEIEFSNINEFNNNDRTDSINITTNLNINLIEYTNNIIPTIYNGFSYYNKKIENITNISDWIKIKHKPLNNTSFYYGNTFEGSVINDNVTIGDINDNNSEWAISFDDTRVKFYLFIIHDSYINSNYKDRWIVLNKYEMKKASEHSGTYNYHSNYPHAYKTTNNLNGFNENTSTHFNGPNYDQIIYNRNFGLHNGTPYPDPQIALYFIKYDKTYETDQTVLTNDLGYNTTMIYSQISGILGNAEAGVYVKYTDDLPKKILSSSYSSIIKNEFKHNNIIGFYYNSSLEYIYDFSLYNTLYSWTSYANSIGAKTNFNSFYQGGLYLHPGDGYIELPLHSDYNFVSVYYGNPHVGGSTYLYIDNVYKEGCSSNQFKTYTTTYTPGQILKIKEVGGIVSPDLLIKFSNTINSKYSITFPNDTECDILIVGGGGSGGVRDSGAGGAGGLIYLNNIKISSANLTIGKGGDSVSNSNHVSGNKGENSIINIIDSYGNTINYTAEGGGKGGEFKISNNNSTGNGGSGGGGGGSYGAAGIGNQSSSESGGYGNDGGQGGGKWRGGSGGGAGGQGTTASYNSGANGGIGMDFSHIFGTEYGISGWFAGGGGTGSGVEPPGMGGQGGGGSGSNNASVPAQNGIDGTGGGGGGHRNSGGTSGKGGDGIILIKYNKQQLLYNEIKKNNIISNPIVHYKFDGDLTNSVIGSSIGSLLVTNTSPQFIASSGNFKFGKSALVNNTTLTIPDFHFDDLIDSSTKDFTVSFWFKANSIYEKWNVLFDCSNYSGYMAGIRVYIKSTTNELLIASYNDGSYSSKYISSLTGGFIDNQWRLYTFTFTYNSHSSDVYSYDVRFYEDSVLNGGINTLSIKNINTHGFQIGDGNPDTVYPTEGYYDDFRIYDKALSATEVSNLYNNNFINDYYLNKIVDGDVESNSLYYEFTHDNSDDNHTEYTFELTSSSDCEILIVGGGGGGGEYGGGGGGGDVIYFKDIKLNKGLYNVKVGKGGIGGGPNLNYEAGHNGNYTKLYLNSNNYITAGGGGGGNSYGEPADAIINYTYNINNQIYNSQGAGGGGGATGPNNDNRHLGVLSTYSSNGGDSNGNYGGGGGGGYFYSVLDCDEINLKSWYKFENNLLDNIQNNNIIKNSGLIIYENGIINKALDIGSGIYTINSNILSSLFDDNIWSISIWYYRTELTTNCSILSRYDNTELPRCGFNLYLHTGYRKIKLERQQGTGNSWVEVWSLNSIEINTWYHIVAISNKSDLKLYINGVLNDEKSTTTYWSAPAFGNLIGLGSFVKSEVILTSNSNGLVEDLRIYDKELTYDDIQKLILNSNGGTRIGNIAGNGGNGFISSITSENKEYGGGGGGGTWDHPTSGSNGGDGKAGGGNGGRERGRLATAGIKNTGGGGGGGGGGTERNGANGGSGIVIIKTKPKSIRITNTENIANKYIELELANSNRSIIDSISSLKCYWNTQKILQNVSSERLYPHPNARATSFKKINGISPEIYEINGNDYGNGTYTVKFSSQFYTDSNSPHYVFAKGSFTPENNATWGVNNYSYYTDENGNVIEQGRYNGTEDLTGDNYKGDWVSIEMPVKIIPTKIIFSGVLYNTIYLNRLPRNYRLYGSNNGTDWDIIINENLEIDNTNFTETYNNIDNIAYEKKILSSKAYNNFALVVNKIGAHTLLAIGDLDIYGCEINYQSNSIVGESIWKTILYDQYDNNIELENNIELKQENLIYTSLNNNITAYNYFEYILFSEERLYPPYSVRNNIDNFTFNIENNIYGNGTYTITWSSLNVPTASPLNTFIENKEYAMWESNAYTNNGISLTQIPSRATYNGNNYIISDYKGDWIKINLPYKILLSRFIIGMAGASLIDNINHTNINYFPHDFKIYGSNDNTNWNLIIHKTINRLDLNYIYNNSNNSYSALNYKINDNERLTKFEMYSYYALVVNKTGGAGYLLISSWQLYGKEKNQLLLTRPTNIPIKHNIKFSQLVKVYRDDIDFTNNVTINNVKFSDYYLSGSYIPINSINENIPNSGEISFSDFKGTTSEFIISIPYENDRIAHYTSDSETMVFNGSTITQWNDISDNNRNIVTYRGSPHIENFVKNSKGLTGDNTIPVVSGDENSGFIMPFTLESNNYTFCYMARYVGDSDTTYNERIFDSRSGTGQNTCWGFHNNHTGKSHNGEKGWHTVTNKHISDNNTWLIGVETTNSSRFNGMNCDHTYTDNTTNYPRAVSNGIDPILTINYGHYTSQGNSNEISKWQVAEMIFYNRELTLEEKKEVEFYLSTKYSHISFNNVISSLNDYKNLSQTGLYDLWYSIYDGNKYAYSTNGTYYGPYNYLFDIIKSSNYYYAEWNRVNTNGTSVGYSNRNTNLIYYSIVLPLSDIQYKVNMVALGGGGGGGRAYGGGGGAGGQAYVINRTQLQNVTISISVGGRGYGGGLWVSNQNSSGGDTTITFNGTTMIGYGGFEGRDSTRSTVSGGSYSGGDGGGAGGSSINWGCGGACGAAISTVLKNVTLTSQTFWDVLSSAPIYHPSASWLSWTSVQSGSWGNNPPGAGGAGSRLGRSASAEGEVPSWSNDQWARNGCWGGGGAAVIIIEFPVTM